MQWYMAVAGVLCVAAGVWVEEARFAAEDPANFAGVKRDMDRSRGTLTRTGGFLYILFVV